MQYRQAARYMQVAELRPDLLAYDVSSGTLPPTINEILKLDKPDTNKKKEKPVTFHAIKKYVDALPEDLLRDLRTYLVHTQTPPTNAPEIKKPVIVRVGNGVITTVEKPKMTMEEVIADW